MRIVTFEGSPYQLGYQLGLEAKSIFASYIKNSHHFTKLLPWRESDWLASVDAQIQQVFPRIYQELCGLADGCNQNYMDILLWNCRGDLLASGPEGCTSIAIMHSNRAIVAHNEDGDPNLKGHCFLFDGTLDNDIRIISFAYPGSILGHTIAANSYGLAYTVNNIRLLEQGHGLPRMVVSRALLESKDCQTFTDQLGTHSRSGGFHYTVADTQTTQPLGVEAPFHSVSINKADPTIVHANHLVHPILSDIKQNITESSRSRQIRMQALVDQHADTINETDCFSILQDIETNALPIFRTEANDPDEENTLATAILTLKNHGVEIVIYDMSDIAHPIKHQLFLERKNEQQ